MGRYHARRAHERCNAAQWDQKGVAGMNRHAFLIGEGNEYIVQFRQLSRQCRVFRNRGGRSHLSNAASMC
jgi:hypothetical protein